jgi:hypothetical protein
MEETAVPPDYQRVLAIVRQADGPVKTKNVGAVLGLETVVRGRLEPLRGRLTKPVGRGWPRKLPDERFTTHLRPHQAVWA